MSSIIMSNSVSVLIDAPQNIREELEKRLVYKSKGYQYTQAYQDGRWDGNRSLFWNRSGFPTGLTSNVVGVVNSMGEPCAVVDSRLKPENGPGLRFYGQDRDYQDVEKVCLLATRGIINFATGSGKTAVAARIISRADVKTLYVVPTKELLYQTKDEFERFLGIPVGIIGDGEFDFREFVTVATMQTLWSLFRRGTLPRREKIDALIRHVDMLFIDEAQYLGADSFFKTVQTIDCYYKFGLTGTAFRADDAGILLQAATGRVIAKISSSDLIRAGVLANTTIRMYNVGSAGYLGQDWNSIYDKGVVHNSIRNAKIVELVEGFIQEGKSVMIIVKIIDHGYILQDMIRESVYMHGSRSSTERKMALDSFRKGLIKVLIGTKIYDEGVDIPSMDVLVLACGGSSPVKSIQRVGRALRKTSTKDNALIVDFMDISNRTLLRQSRDRLKAYSTESEFRIESISDGVAL